MCGIAGIVGDLDAHAADKLVAAMVGKLRHRGPDASGVVVDGPCALGHARLSIIDLNGGRQPMRSGAATPWITYNGEIYNHSQIRAVLERRGHRFVTRCDTEVILAGYREWGRGVVDRLNGMFAFAMWDPATQSLFAARDRVGIKPLYYCESGDMFAFASEPKALLTLPWVSRELDPAALDAYLDLLYVPPPLSMFSALRQLPPGHWITRTRGHTQLGRYWDAPPCPRSGLSASQWVDLFEPLVVDAIQTRTQADVPVGAFLSGGLDSSTIVAVMAEASSQRVQTFSVGYGPEGASYDERACAAEVARFFGTNHHELKLDVAALHNLDGVVQGFDEPFGSPTALLSFALSGFAREHVKVALAGDGGDEVFGGYPRYRGMRLSKWAARMPAGLRAASQWALRGEEASSARSYRRWLRQFIEGVARPEPSRYASWVGYADVAQRDALLRPEFVGSLGPRSTTVEAAYARAEQGGPIARASYADLHGFLPENVLRCSDRMSMAHGLEVRVPYCDHRLLELAAQLPDHQRIGAWVSKRILRRVARKRLPSVVLRQRKLGFNGPVGIWLRSQLQRVRRDQLAPDRVRRRGLLRPASVSRYLDEHQSGLRDHSLRIWSLVVLEQWQRMYLDEL